MNIFYGNNNFSDNLISDGYQIDKSIRLNNVKQISYHNLLYIINNFIGI